MNKNQKNWHLTLLNKLLIATLSIGLLPSCSYFNSQKKEKPPEIQFEDFKFNRKDIEDHLSVFENFYLSDDEVKLVKLTKEENNYLNRVIENIITNNELFFEKRDSAKIFVVNDMRPFYFSLPGRKIFLSLSLFKKYIKNEHILASILSYELIRSEKSIYRKNIIAPTGVMTTERIISLLRIDIENRLKIHKWAYYLMRRAGYDSSIYLNWIQIQNRNALDFKMMYGDTAIISREEAMFKGFLIRSNKESFYEKSKVKSSNDFYSLNKRMNRINYETRNF